MSKPLDFSFVKSTCKIGQGTACCRYLGLSDEGWECMKLTEFKSLLDGRAERKEMNAQSDNCEGK